MITAPARLVGLRRCQMLRPGVASHYGAGRQCFASSAMALILLQSRRKSSSSESIYVLQITYPHEMNRGIRVGSTSSAV